MRSIKDKIVFITGVDQGIGLALVDECVKRGAKKVYAAGITFYRLLPLLDQYPGVVVPLVIDISDAGMIESRANKCKDVNMLINYSDIAVHSSFLTDSSAQSALLEMKFNYIGLINIINYFSPMLSVNHPSCIVNILSLEKPAKNARLTSYSASQAAGYVLTRAVRKELSSTGIAVIAVHHDHKMSDLFNQMPRLRDTKAEALAKRTFDGIESGKLDV